MEKFVNEYLPRVNFVLLVVLVVMVSVIGFDYFREKREKREKLAAVVKQVEDSKIVVVVKDGIFYVLDGKEVSIESLSPLVIRYQDNVFRKDGRFYLYTKGNIIYVFDMYNENLIGKRKGGGR
uniref:Uncharacterized protein n=1 Tax=Thermocrinis ruber TaxID=75906 RepID=A0A7C5SYS3_9AQUI